MLKLEPVLKASGWSSGPDRASSRMLKLEPIDKASGWSSGLDVFKLDLAGERKTALMLNPTSDAICSRVIKFNICAARRPQRQHQRNNFCLLYTSPSPRDGATSRMPSSA